MKTKESAFDHTGSSFDSFLEEEGILEEVRAVAIKRVIAWQLSEAMKAGKISKKARAPAAPSSTGFSTRTIATSILKPLPVRRAPSASGCAWR